MYNIIEEKHENAILIAADNGTYDMETSLNELQRLTETANGTVCLKITQKIYPDKKTYVGSGKLEEIKEVIPVYHADLIICDCELSPSQKRNIEEICNIRVIDRTMLILDIFAKNAHSAEGKIQVELAALQYSLPFLTGMGSALSRLGGGIGTRGPGETKLETDKRHIRTRIDHLKTELAKIEDRKKLHIEKQKKDQRITASIIGYTNAGKSTLINALTNAGVLEEDKLFATLDTTSRKLTLSNGINITVIDTVGFISRIPTKLVEAFKSTLSVIKNSDIILNVMDCSSNEIYMQKKTTDNILESLGVNNIPIINILNKSDKLFSENNVFTFKNTVSISAKEKTGLDKLDYKIIEILKSTFISAELLIPFNKSKLIERLQSDGNAKIIKYESSGTLVNATFRKNQLSYYKKFIKN